MLANFSDKLRVGASGKIQWNRLFLLPLWVVVGFGISNIVLSGLVLAVKALGFSFVGINPALLNTILAACIYSLSLLFVVGVPWFAGKHSTDKQELGLGRLPSWADVGLAPVGFVLYFLLSAFVLYIASLLLPGFDSNQLQETGFGAISQRYEYLLAFITLVVAAPVAEEVLFRGYMYGKLRKNAPIWLAMLITSLVFGAIHGQWNVAVDVFALSIVLCALREVTGSIWAGILLHMMKNGIAFYLLFIKPTLVGIM